METIERLKSYGFTYNQTLNQLIKNDIDSKHIFWTIIDISESTFQFILHSKSLIKDIPYNSTLYRIPDYRSRKFCVDLDTLDYDRIIELSDKCFRFYLNKYIRKNISIGDTVRHFKSNPELGDHIYKIIAISLDCVYENKEPLITYQDINNGQKSYVRKYSEFMSFVDFDKYPDTKQDYRFEVVTDDSGRQEILERILG